MILARGCTGNIARCTVDATGSAAAVHFEMPDLTTQAGMYTDKTVVFAKTGTVTLDVP